MCRCPKPGQRSVDSGTPISAMAPYTPSHVAVAEVHLGILRKFHESSTWRPTCVPQFIAQRQLFACCRLPVHPPSSDARFRESLYRPVQAGWTTRLTVTIWCGGGIHEKPVWSSSAVEERMGTSAKGSPTSNCGTCGFGQP